MILDITDSCNYGLASLLSIIKNILNVIQIIGPILCILSLIITFVKIINNPEDKKLTPRIKNSIFALILVFFIPLLVNVFMNMMDDTFSIAKCWNNVDSISINSTYQSTNSDSKKSSVISNSSDYEKGKERVESSTDSSNSTSSNNSNNSTASTVSCTEGYCTIAHQGYSNKYKGNTVEAFSKAGEAGFWGVETDLRMTSNGTLVCNHDDSSSGTLFSDYLDVCKKYGMFAVIDIKSGGGEEKLTKAMEMVNSKGLANQVVWQCSMTSYLKIVRKLSSTAKIWYLRDTYDSSVITTAKSLNAEVVNINWANTSQSTITSLHNAGIKVGVYVLLSSSAKKKFVGYGADYIMSNGPLS